MYFSCSERKKPACTQLASRLSSSSPSQLRISRKSCLHFSLRKIILKEIQNLICLPVVIDVRDGNFYLVFAMEIAHNVGSVRSGQR